jgi:hypothetical protein
LLTDITIGGNGLIIVQGSVCAHTLSIELNDSLGVLRLALDAFIFRVACASP